MQGGGSRKAEISGKEGVFMKKGFFAFLAAGACLLGLSGLVHPGTVLAAPPKVADLMAGVSPATRSSCPGLPEEGHARANPPADAPGDFGNPSGQRRGHPAGAAARL